ncbi:MAG: hypothetical protein ACTSWY_10280 [Promethearchaeota archaeon]
MIKTTISKFSATGNDVDLSKISALLDINLSSLIIKLEKWLKNGTIKGTLDKYNAILSQIDAQDNEKSRIQKAEAESIPIPSEQQNLYGITRAEFVKTKTKETSKEDLIKLLVNLAYVGSNIRVGIKVVNNSNNPITEVSCKLLFSKNLKFFKIKPEYEYSQLDTGISIKILNKLKEKSHLILNVYFKPETLDLGEIKGGFQYVNFNDFVRFIPIENLFYNLTPPKVIPKEILAENIEEFTKNKELKKDLRSYGLPDELNPSGAFNHVIQIIRQYNFKLISKMEQKQLNQYIAWFFGETEENNIEIMIVGQIINKKIEFYASSINERVIGSLLTAFSIAIKKRIINSKVINNEDEIYDLYCSKCGAVLPFFPKEGESVICKYCGLEQTIR